MSISTLEQEIYQMIIPERLGLWFMLTASALLLLIMIFFAIQNMVNDFDGTNAFRVELSNDTQLLSQLNNEINNYRGLSAN